MSRDEKIMEMADDIRRIRESYYGQADYLFAMKLYEDGYCKSTDVAEEIFAEIEDKFDKMIDEATNELSSARLECDLKAVKFLLYHIDVLRMARITIGTLQKKYIDKDTNVTINTEGGE